MARALVSFLLIFIFGTLASAQTLVVSDIDDTLKIANILNTKNAAKYLLAHKSFAGMPEVIDELAGAENVILVYLSNAPSNWMGKLHQEFLDLNLFPEGSLILRDDYPKETHKLLNLRQLRERYKPEQIILIGDNGERDAEIYAQFVKENWQTPIRTFIRQAYSAKDLKYPGKNLVAGQFGFVTSLDLSLLMYEQGILSQEMFDSLEQKLEAAPLFGDESFPTWINCSDFRWNVSEKLTQSKKAFVDHRQQLLQRCHLL